jgi:hypothetical protein
MTVLPNGFDDHNRGIGRNVAEDFHTALLRINEAVFFSSVDGMAALYSKSEMFCGVSDGFFYLPLGCPANAVG